MSAVVKMRAGIISVCLFLMLFCGVVFLQEVGAFQGIQAKPVSPAVQTEPLPEASSDKGRDPHIIARVGAHSISDADIDEIVSKKIQTRYSHGQDLTKRPEYRREALKELIEAALLSYEAEKRGIIITDAIIDSVVAKNSASMGSEQALRETLQQKGYTMEAFRQRIRMFRAANEVLLKLIAESEYQEEELNKYYEENQESFRRPESLHLHTILVKVAPTANEAEWQEKKEKAEELLRRITAGETFYDIAYYNSDDPYRVKGGDLGFVHKGMLSPPEIDEAAFRLKPGEISAVIRALDGYHILKASERKQGELLSFDKVRQDLAKKLQKRRYEEKKEEVLTRLRADISVTIFESYEEKP